MTRHLPDQWLIEPERLPSLHDWQAWLELSSTPPPALAERTQQVFHIRDGVIVDQDAWPASTTPRIYVAYNDDHAVYVGQTTRTLAERIRKHVGQQRTATERQKAGTWRYVVSASFPCSGPIELDDLERSAAQWLLPLRHRVGHRHPRPLT